MKKAVVPVILLVAIAVGTYMAIQYVRQMNQQAAFPAPVAEPGAPSKLTFIKDAPVLPNMVLQTLDGKTLNSDDWKGKVVLVNFWATWCPPCREEIPDLIRLQDRYKDHLVIIGVSSDEGPTELVAKFVADHKINYPIVMETKELGTMFPGVYALPTTFTLDGDLRIVQKHIGRVNTALLDLTTRYLAKLPVDAGVEVEYVAASATDPALGDQAQATDVPGLALDTLTPEQKVVALKRLNEEKCDCGCGLTLAQCRINDPSCVVSLPLAEKVVAEVKAR